MARGDSSYILKLSQVELEEGIDSLKPESNNIFAIPATKTIPINFFRVNSWFEFARNNVLDEEFPLLYCSFELSDDIIIEYYALRNSYSVDSLRPEDFNDLPEMLGKMYASYFYDYVMNLYLLENFPEDKKLTYYYHYDNYYKIVEALRSEDGHFIEIVEEN